MSGWLLDSSGRSKSLDLMDWVTEQVDESIFITSVPHNLRLLWVHLSRVRLPFASRPCCATHKTVPGEHHPPVKLFHVTGKAWGCWLSSPCYWEVSTKVCFLVHALSIKARHLFVYLYVIDGYLNTAHKCMRWFDHGGGTTCRSVSKCFILVAGVKAAATLTPIEIPKPMQC